MSAEKGNFSPRHEFLRLKSLKQLNSSKKNSESLLHTLKLTTQLSEQLSNLRMKTATTKARLSNERFKVIQMVSRDKETVNSLMEEMVSSIEIFKDHLIGRLEAQAASFVLQIDENLKRVSRQLPAGGLELEELGLYLTDLSCGVLIDGL